MHILLNTKVFTLANHKRSRQYNESNQSELEVITRGWRKAWENACERGTIGSDFTSDWMKKWHEFFLVNPTVYRVDGDVFKPIIFGPAFEDSYVN